MSKKVDTRVLHMKDGTYIPQVKVKHFLFGHHWEGLYELDGEIYQTNSDSTQLSKCKTSSEKAEKLLAEYTSHKLDIKLLQEG